MTIFSDHVFIQQRFSKKFSRLGFPK